MKTYSDFGWVRRGNIYALNEQYLFVMDKPKNEKEREDPRIKTSGGNNNNPYQDVLIFLPRKIYEETRISVIFASAKRDCVGKRKPLIEVEVEDNHFLRIWEMIVSPSDLFKTPISGENIRDAQYMSVPEIIKTREKGKFLDNHSLVVDQQIISRF
jgi:hypothetical protein